MKQQNEISNNESSENPDSSGLDSADEFETSEDATMSEDSPMWLFESTITNMSAFENTVTNLKVEEIEAATTAAAAGGDPAWRVLERRREERELKAMLEDDLLADTIQ